VNAASPTGTGNAGVASNICHQLRQSLGSRLQAIYVVGNGYGTDEKNPAAKPDEKTGRQSLGDVLVSKCILDCRGGSVGEKHRADESLLQRFMQTAANRRGAANPIWAKCNSAHSYRDFA
jgi:hypothetical protein